MLTLDIYLAGMKGSWHKCSLCDHKIETKYQDRVFISQNAETHAVLEHNVRADHLLYNIIEVNNPADVKFVFDGERFSTTARQNIASVEEIKEKMRTGQVVVLDDVRGVPSWWEILLQPKRWSDHFDATYVGIVVGLIMSAIAFLIGYLGAR